MEYKIIVDSREKENKHIIRELKKNNITYAIQKLSVGDYAIQDHNGYSPAIVIERKQNLNEIIINLFENKSNDATGKNRFIRELDRAKDANIKMVLLIEDNDFYLNIMLENYRSRAKANSVRGMLLSLEAKYPNLSIVGIDKSISASYIHSVLYYQLKQDLKVE